MNHTMILGLYNEPYHDIRTVQVYCSIWHVNCLSLTNAESRSMGDAVSTEEFAAHVDEKHMNENWGFHEEYSVTTTSTVCHLH